MKIVIATQNRGKLAEFFPLFAGTAINLMPQSDFNIPAITETGLTFTENAILKARHAAAHAGLPALADDSGLCVAALNGAPGVYSARYAGENASDKVNIEKLLAELKDVPFTQRDACFYCVLAYLRAPDDPAPIICQGKWQGKILLQSQGENGFGYDPVFYVPSHHCSAAELDAPEKNALSHRGQALRQLMSRLPELF